MTKVLKFLALFLLLAFLGAALVAFYRTIQQARADQNYSCTPLTCSVVGCNNPCTAYLDGIAIYWSGSAYTVPSGCYSILTKCARVDNIAEGTACSCPADHITDPWGEGYDTCDLPNIERYFVRGPATHGWVMDYCGTQQVDISCGGDSYHHSMADLGPEVCEEEVSPTPTMTPTPTSELTSTPTPTSELTSTPTPTSELTSTPTPTSELTSTPTPTSQLTSTPTPTEATLPDVGVELPTLFGAGIGVLLMTLALILAI